MNEKQDYELPETHIERMDRLRLEHDQKLERERLVESGHTERARIKLRERRQETYQNVGVSFVVGLVTLGIGILIYFGTKDAPLNGPSDAEIEQRREQACVASGGGWVPRELLVAASGLCVHPGKVASNG